MTYTVSSGTLNPTQLNLWWHCDTLCTSGLADDVTFGCNGPYGNAWKAESLTYYH